MGQLSTAEHVTATDLHERALELLKFSVKQLFWGRKRMVTPQPDNEFIDTEIDKPRDNNLCTLCDCRDSNGCGCCCNCGMRMTWLAYASTASSPSSAITMVMAPRA